MRDLVLIAHNLRSSHNVGSLLRTADGLGVSRVYLTGYTPYPAHTADVRLPHISRKLDSQIAKTALGAEHSVNWEHRDDIPALLAELRQQDFTIVGLEQSASSLKLQDYQAPMRIAMIVGREVEGIEPEVIALCDELLEIPMFGQKESFNVVQAAAMALYQLRFLSPAER
jgi:23S rRNA (guanosine2251-2'-O)-methyltransferase